MNQQEKEARRTIWSRAYEPGAIETPAFYHYTNFRDRIEGDFKIFRDTNIRTDTGKKFYVLEAIPKSKDLAGIVIYELYPHYKYGRYIDDRVDVSVVQSPSREKDFEIIRNMLLEILNSL